MTQRNVLVVGVDAQKYERFAPLLERKHFEVDRFPGAKLALELVTQIPFTAILIQFPLADATLDEVLTVIRNDDSASCDTRIALLTTPDQFQAAKQYLPDTVQLVVSDDEAPDQIDEKVSEFLGIKTRASMRIVVKLEVILDRSGREQFMAQTKDISSSGMFLATERLFPVGSVVLFEFTLPNDSKAYCGDAEIVRHSGKNDRIRGMGIRFLSFSQNTPESLTARLERLKVPVF
ncbi:MAG: PilZ domain-containing protein [bacterium]|nr:PilZ domain-containing protein [bacterium]